jgi:hypothetical protein
MKKSTAPWYTLDMMIQCNDTAWQRSRYSTEHTLVCVKCRMKKQINAFALCESCTDWDRKSVRYKYVCRACKKTQNWFQPTLQHVDLMNYSRKLQWPSFDLRSIHLCLQCYQTKTHENKTKSWDVLLVFIVMLWVGILVLPNY